MIKFFRKIRQRLLKDNKISNYLLYAIGEIFLVMIGILLALQVNNWNEKRKTQAQNIQLLKRAHQELVHNIKYSDENIRFYRRIEQDFYRVRHQEATIEDYRNGSLLTLMFNYSPIDLSDDDAKNLESFDDRLSTEQDSLAFQIIDLYKTFKPRIDVYDERVENAGHEHTSKVRNSQPWFHKDWRKLDEEDYSYFLENPFYLNEVFHYEVIALRNHHRGNMNFNTKAKNIYQDLTSFLGLESDSTIIKSPKHYQHYIGKYERENELIEIKEQNNRLVCIWPNRETESYEFYPENDSLFVSRYHFSKLLRNENNEVTGMIRTLGSSEPMEYIKVD